MLHPVPHAILVAVLTVSPVALEAQTVLTGPPSSSRSWLGVGVIELQKERIGELGLRAPHGVEIARVVPGSPAEKAGLAARDVVLSYRGDTVQGVEHFARLVRETPPGRRVELDIARASGGRSSLSVTMGERLARNEPLIIPATPLGPQVDLPNFDMPRPHIALLNRALGVELEAVGGQLAQFFGVEQGVLVRDVNPGSPAETAGLEAGDVITAVGGEPVDRPESVRRHLNRSDEESVKLDIVRRRAKRIVEVRPDSEPRTRFTRLP